MADGDGFSTPDPAPIDPDGDPDDERVPFPAELEDDADVDPEEALDGRYAIMDTEASCLNCSHFEVCAVFSGIKPLMEDWHTGEQDGEPPIDVEKLAWHCRKYDPVE